MTSDLKWRFSPKRPSDKTRDPVAGEFFSSDAIKDAGEALVREAIQNSLDARVDRINGKARVRIYISGDQQEALPAKAHEFWFSSIWQHYEAPKNGLRPKSFAQNQACRFLVFEDFETTGLVGDREQYEQIDGKANPVFYFFRAERATENDKERLGRWGIGKQVFPRASRAQTFLATRKPPRGAFSWGGAFSSIMSSARRPTSRTAISAWPRPLRGTSCPFRHRTTKSSSVFARTSGSSAKRASMGYPLSCLGSMRRRVSQR